MQHALLSIHSPLENTPHKAGNGEISITCRNRHCPKCQGWAREKWLEQRRAELLPIAYLHVVFTLPEPIAAIAFYNKKLVYDILFRATAETLLTVARDPKRLGVELGFFAVLHSWGQNLHFHPHLHCVVPGGGVSVDQDRWIHGRRRYRLPVKVLSRFFRRVFLQALERAYAVGQLFVQFSLNGRRNQKKQEQQTRKDEKAGSSRSRGMARAASVAEASGGVASGSAKADGTLWQPQRLSP